MSIELEAVAERAQKYVANCPAIILGTGATIPYGIPSMGELSNHLVKTINVTQDEIDYIAWKTIEEGLQQDNDLEKALHVVDISKDLLRNIIRTTWEFINQKDLAFYHKVIWESDKFALAGLFKYLLRIANPRLSIITTNYDRLAEYAADIAEAPAFTGFTSGLICRFISDDYKFPSKAWSPGSQGQIDVWKVHGSLDWFKDKNDDLIAVPLSTKIPDQCDSLIVTPGITKYREVYKNPYRTVMAQMDKVLSNARCYLCIGFGFNDEHIQPILERRIHLSNIPIVVAVKTLTSAGKRFLLDKPTKNFLILEEGTNGTVVYNHEHPTGTLLSNKNIWKLPEFLKMILGSEEVNNEYF
jgi:hypothetical protein